MSRAATLLGTARRGWLPLRHPRWGRRRPAAPGYSLLVPVPGDLPVFARIALAVTRLQDPASRVETLVVPDIPSPAVDAVVAAAATDWAGPLRVVPLPLADRLVLPRLGDPGKNHGAQIVAATTASRATHVLLHDADLFLLAADVHEAEYRYAAAHGSAAVGVDGPWDPWFARHGRSLVATWEMCADVDWLRATPPFRLYGHDARLFGERHTFDTTFWAQCHTHPSRLAVLPRPDDVVHFNYVISSYRRFQRSGPGPFADDNLRLLLIRLFVDLFDPAGTGYAVPDRATLIRGLTDPDAPAVYAGVDPAVYRAFRARVDGILTGAWVEPDRRSAAAGYLDPFDAHFT